MPDPAHGSPPELDAEILVNDSDLLFEEEQQRRGDTMPAGDSRSDDLLAQERGFGAARSRSEPALRHPNWERYASDGAHAATFSQPARGDRRSMAHISGAQLVRPGAVLAARYRVEYLIGRSGRGVVVQASHLELGSYVTLKYLLPEFCVFLPAVARFLRSARAASQVQSEHAVRVIDVGRLETGAPYLVTEGIRGPSLRDVLRTQGPLPISDAVDSVIQASEAVAEAHTHGIVHRALNPASLILAQRSDGSVLIKVRDFCDVEALDLSPHGIDSFVSLEVPEASGDLLAPGGSITDLLPYMSPEQFRAASTVDARADVWSLGLVLHELLAGSAAFQADTTAELLTKIAADAAPALTGLRPDVPADLESIVLRCLSKDREQRPSSVAELVAALKPHAPPESQALADRVIKILTRSSRPAAHSSHPPRALVHVGPPPSSVAPVAASAPPPAPGSSGVRTVFAAALVSIGGIVGATFGAGFAARSVLGQEPPQAAAQPALVVEPAAPPPAVRSEPSVASVPAAAGPEASGSGTPAAPHPSAPAELATSAELAAPEPTQKTAATSKPAPHGAVAKQGSPAPPAPAPKKTPKPRGADREEAEPSIQRAERPSAALPEKGIDLFNTIE